MDPQVQAVVLAAGMGTRMKSKVPKVLHPLGGKPLLWHVLHTLDEAGIEKRAIVVGHLAEQVKAAFPEEKNWFLQAQQLGTAHAVAMAREFLAQAQGFVFILYGDTPLLRSQTLQEMLALAQETGRGVLLGAKVADPTGYGRLIRNEEGLLAKIVEEKDASPEERAICEINAGVYCLPKGNLWALAKISNNNKQKEFYLTDIVEILAQAGDNLAIYTTPDPDEILGVNSRRQLAELEAIMRERKLRELLDSGVTIVDPASTFVAPTVEVGQDSTILPFTILEGETAIGEDCIIGPRSRIAGSKIGNGCRIQESIVLESVMEEGVSVGPFAYIRPGTIVRQGARVGDFVELKNSTIGPGSKVPHLSYIGDCEIGAGVNIGAGTITCNYDGVHKHRTIIEDGAFIGSNTNLVAPIKVGQNALVGAGSTLTEEVPPGALAIARARQVNLPKKEKNISKQENT